MLGSTARMLWHPSRLREQQLRIPSVGIDEAAAEGAAVRPKVGALPVLAGAADVPTVVVPAKLKPLKAPVAGLLATAAGALAAALAAPEPNKKPDELDGTGAAARSVPIQLRMPHATISPFRSKKCEDCLRLPVWHLMVSSHAETNSRKSAGSSSARCGASVKQ